MPRFGGPAGRKAGHCGFATGGVRTRGGRGFGGGRTAPGTGRTSIGGGRGATCWLTTGAEAFGAAGLGGVAGGRGTLTVGFGWGRRGSRPGIGIAESG